MLAGSIMKAMIPAESIIRARTPMLANAKPLFIQINYRTEIFKSNVLSQKSFARSFLGFLKLFHISLHEYTELGYVSFC